MSDLLVLLLLFFPMIGGVTMWLIIQLNPFWDEVRERIWKEGDHAPVTPEEGDHA